MGVGERNRGRSDGTGVQKTLPFLTQQHNSAQSVEPLFLLHVIATFELHTMNGTNRANGTPTSSKLLWRHASPQSTPMYKFLRSVNQAHGLQLSSYHDLHKWSINNVDDFWGRAWDFVGIKHQGNPSSVNSHASEHPNDAADEQ